jgi:hypothetical protein
MLAASIIALMTETASTSEMPVNFYQTTRRNNLEDRYLHGFKLLRIRNEDRLLRTLQGNWVT